MLNLLDRAIDWTWTTDRPRLRRALWAVRNRIAS